ncbi:MAG: hypothetical protein ACM3QX_18280 [Syntrophomonadaceae bacterium]
MIMSQLIEKMAPIIPMNSEGVYFRYHCNRCGLEYQEMIAVPRALADEILLMAISGEETTYDLHDCEGVGVGVSTVIGYDLIKQV